jgi:hypothetical protein
VDSIARIISTGALTALVAGCALLSSNIAAHAGADLALGKTVFEGECCGQSSSMPPVALSTSAQKHLWSRQLTRDGSRRPCAAGHHDATFIVWCSCCASQSGMADLICS